MTMNGDDMTELDMEMDKATAAQKAAAVKLDSQFGARSLPELELAIRAKRERQVGRALNGRESWQASSEAKVRFAHACDPACVVCGKEVPTAEEAVMVRRNHERKAFWLRRIVCAKDECVNKAGFLREYIPPDDWATVRKPEPKRETTTGIMAGASV